MSRNKGISKRIGSIQFAYMSPEEIRDLSATKIITPDTYDNDGFPIEMGLMDTTCIIFSSDHGEMAMEHQQYYKMSLYEPSVRVPLIISGPDMKEDTRRERLVY
ncbi:MAG: sulfatase-like hydrolase/transferase, partial [Thermoplasmata archaeon]